MLTVMQETSLHPIPTYVLMTPHQCFLVDRSVSQSYILKKLL